MHMEFALEFFVMNSLEIIIGNVISLTLRLLITLPHTFMKARSLKKHHQALGEVL